MKLSEEQLAKYRDGHPFRADYRPQLAEVETPGRISQLAWHLSSDVHDFWAGYFTSECVPRLRHAGQTIKCGDKCSACCRQATLCSLFDGTMIASAIEEPPPGLLGHATMSRDLFAPITSADDFHAAVMEWFSRNIPCPFLFEESCSIYELRPTCCRVVERVDARCIIGENSDGGVLVDASLMNEVDPAAGRLFVARLRGAGAERARSLPAMLPISWAVVEGYLLLGKSGL